MRHSFRHRLIWVFLAVLTVVQLLTAVFVLNATQNASRQQQMQRLSVGINVFSDILANRSQQLNQSLSLLSADFGFKRAVATKEQETISSVLSNHGKRINANAAILLSPQGQLLSSSLTDLSADDVASLFAKHKSEDNDFVMLNVNHANYQFVFQPVKAPTLIAWVGMGFLLDENVAQQAKTMTGIDVSFINSTSVPVEIISTLAPELIQHLSDTPFSFIDATRHAKGNYPDNYLSQAIQLDAQSDAQWVVLHQSNQRWQLNYQQLRNNMLMIFAFTSVLAFIVAMWVTNGLTKPIDALVNFAKKVGQGENPTRIQGAPAELQTLADTLSTMRSNIEQREQDFIYQSEHDSLTGLFNRFAAEKHIKNRIVGLTRTLLLIDIKHFRQVNDIIGFANGDQLLISFSERLSRLPLDASLLARLDGDAFLLLLEQPITQAEAIAHLQNVILPFDVAGSKITLTIRTGIVQLDGLYQHIDTLLRHVEIALNHACTLGDDAYVYQEGDDDKYQRELSLVRDLPQALIQGQLHLVYQPKVNIQLNTCYAVEALIRWQHPELGFIPPDEFIQLAENSGNISIISEWVIAEAIRQAHVWHQQGLAISVAINLSAHDLTDETLPTRLAQQIYAMDLPINAIAIEVTEGAVMTDTETTINVLNQFKDKGFHIAIDDFGTGHSSLSYLKLLPVNEVKIDRSFIKDIHQNATDRMIVETSIKLIKGLALSVVAEGVETPLGIDILKQMNCDIIQGYVYSKPIKAAELQVWVNEFNRTSA
ncbi:bifunctional diguanylate cyclase/phosphodiesterase [Shewanella sp. OMA3-2]|uniref:bifunctional diguanylate cyclase/phosphodiesterase n=1 Tax=Shewanella sp. OMA3-2 TaxID=2908650 RepID=UPI001F4364FF|nr:EAL domain-containing protein [Shewanella sp. OMA3-2]UJF22369.1 EAL domain-containing protein [Shewanella sp. OMA3-2]